MDKFIYYKGLKFTRDDKTGYYLNSTIRERLHRYVWRDNYGDIPDGYEIHHIDGDKSNNDITNLALIERGEHQRLHGKMLTDEEREQRRANLNENARPAAIAWHKSDAGREWHKEHYMQFEDLLRKQYDKVCDNCGAEYIGKAQSRFCSNACKSAYRRKIKADYIPRICPICNKEYSTNKFAPAQTCGKSCGNVLKWRIRRESGKSCTA